MKKLFRRLLWLLLMIIIAFKLAITIVQLEGTSNIWEEYCEKKDELEKFFAIEEKILIGDGIKIENFPANIEFKMFSNEEQIVVMYYENDILENSQRKAVKLTLSNTYEVLDKQYENCKLEKFETYKQNISKLRIITIMSICLIIELILVYVLLDVISDIRKKSRHLKYQG